MILVMGMNPSGAGHRAGNTMTRLYEWLEYLGINEYEFTNASLIVGTKVNIKPDLIHVQTVTKGYDKIIALGNFPSGALKKLDIEHFKLPHPSPVNRQINDPIFIKDQLNKCKEYLYD